MHFAIKIVRFLTISLKLQITPVNLCKFYKLTASNVLVHSIFWKDNGPTPTRYISLPFSYQQIPVPADVLTFSKTFVILPHEQLNTVGYRI